MADANQEVFRLANATLDEAVLSAAGTSVELFRKQLKGFLNDYMAQLYQVLMSRVGSIPGAPAYRLLNEDYAFKKLARGSVSSLASGRTSWFRNSGESGKALAARDPSADFGAPRAQLAGRGEGLSDLVYLDAAGRPQYRRETGMRGFAPFSVAFRSLVFRLEIRMYPKIQGKPGKKVFDKFGGGDLQRNLAIFEYGRTRSGAFRSTNQPPRPMLIPFLKWYGDENLRTAIQQRFQVTV